MSNLQFVILLVVIFISTNGPTHVTEYIRKVRTWLFKQQATKINATLARHGVLFRVNSVQDFTAVCLSEDFFAPQYDNAGHKKVVPTFVFPKNKLYEKKLQELIFDFLYELCGRQYPISKRFLDQFKNISETEKNLFVPQDMAPEKNLTLMKIRLDKYILDNR